MAEMLEAVVEGKVDALVAGGKFDRRILSLPWKDLGGAGRNRAKAAILTRAGTLAYATPALRRFIGLSHENCVGVSLHHFISSTEQKDYQRLLAEASRGPVEGTLSLFRGLGDLAGSSRFQWLLHPVPTPRRKALCLFLLPNSGSGR
jgi:hypothetical protein